MADEAGAKKSGSVVVVIVLAVLGAVVVFGGILASLAIYGVRKYLAEAKSAEGRATVAALARGMVACQADTGRLPPSSKPIPATLRDVSGKKYQSDPSEWSGDAAFACAKFSMGTPQYFQYQWLLETPGSGHVVALADLDGDGSAEVGFRVAVTCPEGGACTTGAVEAKP